MIFVTNTYIYAQFHLNMSYFDHVRVSTMVGENFEIYKSRLAENGQILPKYVCTEKRIGPYWQQSH